MDLQGVGAITASAVAAISVPVAVLVGRWQMRGTIQAAEASYQAALDTASAAQAQWRRGVQREAYSGFLLAMAQIASAIDRDRDDDRPMLETPAELKSALNAGLTALDSAHSIVLLEGPSTVADAATEAKEASIKFAYKAETQALGRHVFSYLRRQHPGDRSALLPEADGPDAGPESSDWKALGDATFDLAGATGQFRGGDTTREAFEAHESAFVSALRKLPHSELPGYARDALHSFALGATEVVQAEERFRLHFSWRDLAAVWGDDCCACRADGARRPVDVVPAGGAAGAGSPAGRGASSARGP